MRTRSQKNAKLARSVRRSARIRNSSEGKCTSSTKGQRTASIPSDDSDLHIAKMCRRIQLQGGNLNKLLLGFSSEILVLEAIHTSGIPGTPLTSQLHINWFFKTPNFSALGESNGAILFRPKASNYASIDAIVAQKFDKRKDKIIHLYPIQITINKRHRNSVDSFFSKWAPTYLKKLSHDFPFHAIKFTFIWIDKIEAQPTIRKVPISLQRAYPRTLASDFSVIHIPLEDLI